MIKLADFEYYQIDPKNNPFHKALEEKAYLFWKDIWEESYKFFGWEDHPIFSDQWTRQDHVGILTYQGEPIGTMFFKVHDLTRPFASADTYFRMWPQELLSQVGKSPSGNNILVSSWFTLHRDWRKQSKGIDVKFILASLAAETLKASKQEIMVGTMVTRSNMHTLVYDGGAEPLKTGVMEKDLEVDLVWWKKSRLKNYVYPRLNDEIVAIFNGTNKEQEKKKAA